MNPKVYDKYGHELKVTQNEAMGRLWTCTVEGCDETFEERFDKRIENLKSNSDNKLGDDFFCLCCSCSL